jgi:DNA polymerase (family 10)
VGALPTNGELAGLLLAIADYLAFEGETIYRILAYRKAAEAFQEHPTSVAELALQGDLRTLPGVGEAIEKKVLELLTTGRIAVLEHFRSAYPQSLLALIRIPGVGPKTARRLWDTLGVSDVEGLRAASVQGLVRKVPGLGKKIEDNILRAIAQYESREDRRLLGHVDNLAGHLTLFLRAMPQVEKADFAGSLRRRRSTVRDIDLVAAARDPEPVMEEFAAFPQLAAVKERGQTKLVARAHSGVGVDLRIVAPESYGNLLQHSTGSADHNVALRGYAQRRGYKVSEYAVEETSTGRPHRLGSEQEVYGLLGLPWIPPEIRENRGELEAAQEDRLPRLVTLEDLRGDLHVHSDWSDGKRTIEEMAVAARERGLEYICFCDHSQSIGMGIGLTPDQVLQQIEAVREVDARLEGISLLAGSEVDILADGRIDLPDKVLQQLDFVTASIHSGFKQPVDQIMQRLASALDNPWVDAIGHPTGRLLGRRQPYEIDIDFLASRAAATGTLLELNASYDRLDLRAGHARRAKELGAALVVCSDAHSPHGFDLLSYGIGEARRGWLEPADVANTLPLDEFKSRLRRNAG